MSCRTNLTDFCEKYDGSAIESITALSNDISLSDHKFNGIAFSENALMFLKAITGYADRCCEHVDDEEDLQCKTFISECHTFVEEKMFQDEMIPYQKASGLVTSYLEHLMDLETAETNLTEKMISANVPGEQVGGINEMVNDYLDQLGKKIEPVMERLLMASGYRSQQRLDAAGRMPKPQSYIV